MLVLVNGLPLFSQRLVRDLNLLDPNNRYIFTNTYYSKIDKIKFIFLLLFAKIVISFNGVSDESGSLNWVIRFKKKLMMQWQGTDVSLAVERYKSKTINKRYIDYATHFTDAPWLKDELNGVLKSIEILPFKYIETDQHREKFPKISVLSYIGKGREEFYGYEIVKASAKVNPDIDFHIIGIDSKDLDKIENIYFYGWITDEEVKKIMKSVPIFVRLTQHDGNSLAVTEALSYGCEVIWSYPYEKCYLVSSIQELNQIIIELSEKIKDRNYEPNLDNIKFVKENYNKNKVIGNYIKKINEVANK